MVLFCFVFFPFFSLLLHHLSVLHCPPNLIRRLIFTQQMNNEIVIFHLKFLIIICKWFACKTKQKLKTSNKKLQTNNKKKTNHNGRYGNEQLWLINFGYRVFRAQNKYNGVQSIAFRTKWGRPWIYFFSLAKWLDLIDIRSIVCLANVTTLIGKQSEYYSFPAWNGERERDDIAFQSLFSVSLLNFA